MFNSIYIEFAIFLKLLNLLINVVGSSSENKWTSNAASFASGQWISASETTKIITFENQTVYLPCAMQSTILQQQSHDQLTLILWYRSWNKIGPIGPPIYSVDFRNLDRNILSTQKNAIHFISNGELKDRIVFEFNTCWQPDTYHNIWIYKSFRPFNKSTINSSNQFMNYQNRYHFKLNNLNSSLKINNFNEPPICAFLKVNQVKLKDTGRFSCRIDFRRSRTLHTQFLIKVLEQPKIFELRVNERQLVNNSIIKELNEGSSLTVHCLAKLIDKIDVQLQWQCDDQLVNFYSSEDEEKTIEPDIVNRKLTIRHLYRIFNEKKCSCYLVSNFGQRLMHLQFYFQLHLAPLSVSIIKPSPQEHGFSDFKMQSELNKNLILKKRTLRLEADQLTTIQCLATGSRPAANCKWSLLNGFQFKPKDYSESTLIESVSNDTASQFTVATISTLSTLHLLTTNQMHNQVIRCICSNPLLPLIQITDQIHLDVLSKPILHLLPYELNRNKTNFELSKTENAYFTYKHQVKEGDKVQLVCNVLKSNPPLNGDIRWFINDIELEKFKKLYPNAAMEIEYTNMESAGHLVIQKVSKDTTGRFFCIANNSKGETKSNLIMLNVQYIPFCRPSQQLLYTLALGETVNIDCDLFVGSDGSNVPSNVQFYWTLNKQPLPSSMYTIEKITNNQKLDENHLIKDQAKWRPLFELEDIHKTDLFNRPSSNEHNEFNLIRSRLKFNSSNYQFKHATLACSASNSVGLQIEPCLFDLLVIEPPKKPNCSFQYHELDDRKSEECQIEIGCETGTNNDVQQILHLNVYQIITGGLTINSTTDLSNTLATLNTLNLKTTNSTSYSRIKKDKFSISNLIMLDDALELVNTMHPTKIQQPSNHPIKQYQPNQFSLFDQFNHSTQPTAFAKANCADRKQLVGDLIVNQTIAINKTNQYIRFRRFNLSRIQHYLIVIYASNSKGLSEIVEFEWMFDLGTSSNKVTSTSNYFQFLILIGYFFVGIIFCILLTYLFKLQLLIFNYRLLTFKNQNLRSTNRERPYTIQSVQNNFQAYQTYQNIENRQLITINELSVSRLPKCSNIVKDDKYGNIYKTVDRSYNFNRSISNTNPPNLINNQSSYSKSSDPTSFQNYNVHKSHPYLCANYNENG